MRDDEHDIICAKIRSNMKHQKVKSYINRIEKEYVSPDYIHVKEKNG